MAENLFSEFKKKGKVELKGFTRPFRRVGHSTSNYFRAGDKKNLAVGTTVGLNNVWGAVGIGQAGIEIASKIGIVVATTASGALTAGAIGFALPITSVALGVIGLGLAVKSTYSNRDAAHEKLKPYVWSLIDDVKPEKNIYSNKDALDEALSASIYLMKEADSQYKIMGDKYKNAKETANKFFEKFYSEIKDLLGGFRPWVGYKIIEFYEKQSLTEKKYLHQYIQEVHTGLNKIKVSSDELWKTAVSQGGPVFEYMRRLVHLGNYLQCAHIISMATFTKMSGSLLTDPGDILLKYCQDITESDRKYLQVWSDIIKEKNNNYENWERFIMKHGLDK